MKLIGSKEKGYRLVSSLEETKARPENTKSSVKGPEKGRKDDK